MKTFIELAKNFYGVQIPFFKRKGFFNSVMEYLEKDTQLKQRLEWQ